MNWSYQFIDYSVHPAQLDLCPLMDLWVDALQNNSLPHIEDIDLAKLDFLASNIYLAELKDRKSTFRVMGERVAEALLKCPKEKTLHRPHIHCPPERHLMFLMQEIRMIGLPALSGYQTIFGGPWTYGLHLPLRAGDTNAVDFVFGAFLEQDQCVAHKRARRRRLDTEPFIDSLLRSMA